MKRIFIALALDDDLKQKMKLQIKKVEVTARKRSLEIQWVAPDNYHITLNFLGNCTKEQIETVYAVCSQMATEHQGFELKIQSAGAFPSIKHGRVIWLGVQAKIQLMQLQSDLTQQLIKQNFSLEQNEYVPHLTIARLRNKINLEDMLSPIKNIDCGKVNVGKITVFESKLMGKYPKYIPLESFLLEGPVAKAVDHLGEPQVD